MPTPRERAIWARDLSPFIFIYEIDEEVIEERGKSSIIELAPKNEKLFAACW